MIHGESRRDRGILKFAALSLILVSAATACSAPADELADPVATPEDECPAVIEDGVLLGWQPFFTVLPVVLAREDGYFEDAGLPNMELVTFRGGAEATAAQVAGSIQFNATAAERAISIAAQEGDARVPNVMAFMTATPLVLVARTDAGVVPGDLDSLEGKTVGITAPGSGTDKSFRTLIREESSLDPDRDVAIIALGSVSDLVAGIRGGRVDVTMITEPGTSILLADDDMELFYDFADAPPVVASMNFPTLQVTAEYLEQERCTVEKAVEALSRATRDMARDPDLAMRAATLALGDIDEEVLRVAMERIRDLYNPVITDEMAQAVINGMIAAGDISEDDGFTVADVYDATLARFWAE